LLLPGKSKDGFGFGESNSSKMRGGAGAFADRSFARRPEKQKRRASGEGGACLGSKAIGGIDLLSGYVGGSRKEVQNNDPA
jgi:hypothetical protein